MTPTERTKPTDSSTERVLTAGPGYDFSMTKIHWDRTDIYFDNTSIGATERTKPSDVATERDKPTQEIKWHI